MCVFVCARSHVHACMHFIHILAYKCLIIHTIVLTFQDEKWNIQYHRDMSLSYTTRWLRAKVDQVSLTITEREELLSNNIESSIVLSNLQDKIHSEICNYLNITIEVCTTNFTNLNIFMPLIQ